MKWARHRLLGNFATLTGGRLLGGVATFLASLLIARQFGAEILGGFSVLLALTGITSVFASGGFSAIASIYTAKYMANDNLQSLKGFFLAGRGHIVLGAIAIVVVVLIVNVAVPGLFQYPGFATAALIGIAVLAIAGTNFLGAILVGLNRQRAGLLPETLLKPLMFLALVAGFAGIGVKLSPTGLLGCLATAALIAAAVTGYQLARERFMFRTIVARQQDGGWIQTAYPWMITSLVWDFFIELHIVLAGWIAAPAEVAVLHVAFRFRMLAGFGMRTLYSLFLPDIVTVHTRDEMDQVHAKLFKVNLLALGYSAAVVGFFAVAGGLLLGLFGPAFAQGWMLLIVVSMTMVVRAMFGPAPALLAMKGSNRPAAIVMLGCLIFSLGGTLILYPHMGLVGIGASYTAANFIASASLWLYARHVTGIDCSLISSVGYGQK